jgi:hypothetical protein
VAASKQAGVSISRVVASYDGQDGNWRYDGTFVKNFCFEFHANPATQAYESVTDARFPLNTCRAATRCYRRRLQHPVQNKTGQAIRISLIVGDSESCVRDRHN